jgi:hypothetical protein
VPAQDGPLRHPEHEPRSDERAGGEQIELLAQHPVIASACFFQRRQMGVEVGLGKPGGAVEPLELGVVRVALPIRPGDVRELEGPDAAGARHVGPAAEIDELSLPVERERGMGGEAGFDVLGLEGLVEAADDLRRLLPRHLDPLEGLVGLDDPLHLGLDGRQILVGDRPGGPHVVVKALAHRGAEGEFHPVEEPHHGPGHDVGRGMPHHGERPGIAGKEGLEIDRAVAGNGASSPTVAPSSTAAIGRPRPLGPVGPVDPEPRTSATRAGDSQGRTVPSGRRTLSMVQKAAAQSVFRGKPGAYPPRRAGDKRRRWFPAARPSSLDSPQFGRETSIGTMSSSSRAVAGD